MAAATIAAPPSLAQSVPSDADITAATRAAARQPEIRVSQMTPATQAAPVKPESARSKLFTSLRSKGTTPGATTEPAAPATPAAAKPTSAQQAPPSPAVEAPAGQENAPPAGEGAEAAETAPATGEKVSKAGKASPWRLVDEYKKRAVEAEAKMLELQKGAIPETERTAIQERVTKAETRAKELEDHIRFVDYSKSEEFKTKYVAPYEAAWKRAVTELSEINVTDPATNQARAVTGQDLLALVNMPLGEARERADAAFGPFADDVMAHRKEIRTLFDAQNTALEEARTTGAEREKQRQQQMTQAGQQIAKFISDTWNQSNEAAQKDPKFGKFFTPTEGDEEVNSRLKKGFELVDRAFAENPQQPNITPQERATRIRRHVAMRNRAAAFGSLLYRLEKAEAARTELEKELGQYRGSEPATGAPVAQSSAEASPGTAKERMFSELRKRAISR